MESTLTSHVAGVFREHAGVREKTAAFLSHKRPFVRHVDTYIQESIRTPLIIHR
jgi:hypothetical protein